MKQFFVSQLIILCIHMYLPSISADLFFLINAHIRYFPQKYIYLYFLAWKQSKNEKTLFLQKKVSAWNLARLFVGVSGQIVIKDLFFQLTCSPSRTLLISLSLLARTCRSSWCQGNISWQSPPPAHLLEVNVF